MDFEFDPANSEANLRKHGIEFIAAQALWRDPALLEIPARTTGEPRFLVIALLRGRHWSAVITYRGPTIRLISVRRSRLLISNNAPQTEALAWNMSYGAS